MSATVAAERFLARVRSRLQSVEPNVRRAYLRSLREVMGAVPPRELERMISLGSVEQILSQLFGPESLARAFAPVRVAVQDTITSGVMSFAHDIPGVSRAAVSSVFGQLSERVVATIRDADNRALTRLGDQVRVSVREVIERGYRLGEGPRTTARDLRSLIGLGKSELQQVDNFRDALLGRNERNWQTYERRDRRFDGTIARAMESGKGLSSEQVDKMVGAYERRRVALSAEANARTLTLDAYKQSQAASWQTAVDARIIDADQLFKEWLIVGDSRVRDEHEEMSGEIVPFDEPYSNGQDVPGETDYNCRCWSRVFARA